MQIHVTDAISQYVACSQTLYFLFKVRRALACENIRFSSLFAAGDVSARNVPSDEERGEKDVFAG